MRNEVVVVSLLMMSVVSLFGTQSSSVLQLIDRETKISFRDFCAFMQMPDDEQVAYETYYRSCMLQQKKVREKAQVRDYIQRVHEMARSSLEVKHPQWARELEPVLEKKTIALQHSSHLVLRNAQTFLIRYGKLEEFYQQRAQEHSSMWARVKGFAERTHTAVTRWFGGSSESAEAVA